MCTRFIKTEFVSLFSEEMEKNMSNKYESDKIINAIQKMAENTDRIFYFVCPENLSLKEKKMEEYASEAANLLGLSLYGIRSGANIQDPRYLFKELSAIDITEYDIIYTSKESGEISLLSHDQKVQFTKDLEVKDINSGLIAKYFIDTSEASDTIVYKD